MKIPQHIAIILDGNGRWATKQGLSRTQGHEEGAKRIKDIALYANQIGVKYLTLYCFSTENWRREKKEVDYLMQMPSRLLNDKQISNFSNENIRLNWIGRRDRVDNDIITAFEKAYAKTKDNNGLVLSFAFDYGSWDELVHAVQKIKDDQSIHLVTQDTIRKYLYTYNLPDVDLLIRPGGEQRLSNFLLLQNQYAELYFTSVFWPMFTTSELDKAILDYNNRDRRFGSVTND